MSYKMILNINMLHTGVILIVFCDRNGRDVVEMYGNGFPQGARNLSEKHSYPCASFAA
jgi:hypothetical protein